MKGFIAVALSRVSNWKVARLSRPVHLMFSCDEEVGCLGAPLMIEAANKVLPKPAAVIVGEPTNMRVARSGKGFCLMHTRVTGVEVHSSLTHKGASAVMIAAELIAYLGELSRQLAAHSDTGLAAQGLEPAYTTISVNRIAGGTAINILAAACEFSWEIRAMPGETTSEIVDRFKSFADLSLAQLLEEGKRCAIDTRVHVDVPSFGADPGSAAQLVRAAVHGTSKPIAIPFASEAGQFQRAGWSTVVCGPGSIEQAHQPDEFIERSELAACETFLDHAIVRQCQ